MLKGMSPGIPRKTLIAFVMLTVCISIAGYYYYQSEHERYMVEKWKELSAIAGLKEREIEAWRKERLSDANFAFNAAIERRALSALRASDPRFPYGRYYDWMPSMYKNGNYEHLALFDYSHTQRYSVPAAEIPLTQVIDSLFGLAERERRICFSDFYRDRHNRPMLSVVVPVLDRGTAAMETAGFIVMQINPQTLFYPLVQSWPVPSKSGELLLLSAKGDSAAYLNTLRFADNISRWKTASLSDTMLLASKAVKTNDSMLAGLDYRGQQVFAVKRPIDGTGWMLIAKNDAKEVFAPLNQTRFFLVIMVVMISLIGGISILLVWRHRRGEYYRREYEQELERRLSAAALRESEERFRMLVESLNEIVYTLDTQCRFIGVYGHWVELFGVDEASVRGKKPEDIFGADPTVDHREMERRALGGEHVLYESTYSIPSTGEVHVVQTSLSPLRGSAGDIIGIVGVGRDITKIKHLERDLLQSQKMDSLGKLAGGIAHDFNNLLAMLMGSAELLKRNLKDDPQNMIHIRRIFEATERGSSIAKRLLLFSRQGLSEFKPVSVSHILTEIVEILRYSFPKTIEVKLEIEAEHALINGDAGHLHQAFLNLCLNAKDAMGEQGTLTLAERTVGPEEAAKKFPECAGQCIAVSIADTGSGIDPQLVGKIFEPFFTTKEKGKGTGLGLSIVDGIIRNHHGYIDVQSEPGNGTTFTIYFPVYTGPLIEPAPEEAETSASGETILIVDDETMIRELLAEYLGSLGYSVLMAGDAEEAITLYREKAASIDIVISDLGMPKMSGEELFTRLRAIDPSVSVIISSGYLDGTTRNGLLSKGILGVLTKPYRLNDIQALLAECLRNRTRRISS